jgi:hypothetical protein
VIRKVRGLWSIVAIAVVAAGTIWLALFVWRSPHRSDLAAFWAFVAGVVAVALALIGGLISRTRSSEARKTRSWSTDRERTFNELADLLAGAVKDQWTRAAADRRLLHPEPIYVRWERPSQPFAGPVSAAAGSRQFPPLPGLAAVRQGQLRKGGLGDLHALYGGLGSGRMVIVGAPGSGKTGAAVLLILAALKHREQVPEKDRQLVPVPVMFTLHGWDPNTKRIQDWLSGRLQHTYPLFAGKGGAADAAALVGAGKVAVILDGLDEIPEELRPVALRALSHQAVFRIVVLSRSAEMTAAVRQSHLEGAVALELHDVGPQAAADYLTRAQLEPAPAGWRDLTRRLRSAPDSPIAKALSNPLTLTLVRDTYRSADNVRELLDFCDAACPGVSREDIQDHLLDRVLPAAYTPRPGERPPRHQLQAAQSALSYIAAQMNQDGTRDLAWWQIPAWTACVPRVIATGLTGGLVVGLMFVLMVMALVGLVFVFMIGLAVALAFGFWFGSRGRSPRRIAPPRWRQLFSQSSLRVALVGGFVFGLVVGLEFGLEFGLNYGLNYGLVFGFAFGLAFGLVFGLALGFVFGLSQPGAGNLSPLSPLASWRRDQVFALVAALVGGLVGGLVLGLGFWLGLGLVAGVVGGGSQTTITADSGVLVGWLAFGVILGFPFGLAYPETWRASLAFVQLAMRWHTPVRLMRFLEDARERHVLRTVGPVYQFRHARLQDRLAGQADIATSQNSRPPRSPSESVSSAGDVRSSPRWSALSGLTVSPRDTAIHRPIGHEAGTLRPHLAASSQSARGASVDAKTKFVRLAVVVIDRREAR